MMPSGTSRVGCLRLRFDYEHGEVTLARVRYVDLIPPLTEELTPRNPADWAGFWFEVQDAQAAPIYRQSMRSPMVRTEEPSAPDGERLPRPSIPARGSFAVLIPPLADAEALVIYASPIGRGRRRYPARELTRVALPVQPTPRRR
jgi:hypothetical protein